MAKEKKKSAKEASATFHNIIKASVSGNPKQKKKFRVFTLSYDHEGMAVTTPVNSGKDFDTIEEAEKWVRTVWLTQSTETVTILPV